MQNMNINFIQFSSSFIHSASKKLIESHRDSLRKGSSSSSSIQSQAVNVSSQLNGNLVNLQLFPIKKGPENIKRNWKFFLFIGILYSSNSSWMGYGMIMHWAEKRSKTRKTTPIRSLLPTHTKTLNGIQEFPLLFSSMSLDWLLHEPDSSPLINNLFLLSCFKHNNFFFTFSAALLLVLSVCHDLLYTQFPIHDHHHWR